VSRRRLRHALAGPLLTMLPVVGLGTLVLAPTPAAAGLGDGTLTVHVSPNPRVGEQATISGTLSDSSGQPISGATISVRRTDSSPAPSPLGSTQTDASGHWSLTDTPANRGAVTYTANDTFGDQGSDTVDVDGKDPLVSISGDHVEVSTGATVNLTARVASDDQGSPTLWAQPYQQGRTQLGTTATGSGTYTTSFVVHRRTTFTWEVPGDSHYDPGTASITVRARGYVAERLSGGYRSRSGIRIYHAGAAPLLAATLTPHLKGACLFFRAQRKSGSGWQNVAVSSCLHTDGNGVASGRLSGRHRVNDLYRVRAEWHGNRAADRRNGSWLELEFR
jgi:hypothetical protein